VSAGIAIMTVLTIIYTAIFNNSIFDRLFSVFNLKNYVYAECNHVLNTYWSVSSTHTAGKGHMKYHRCKLCHAKFDIHYVSLSSCAICNPAHTCTWVWHSSQTHTSGKGHKSYQKCSGCGAKRNENTYRSLSGCKICYPPHEHSFYYKSYENDSTYHTTYKECSSCSYKKYMWKKEHDFSGVYLYSSKHDDAHGGHLKYKICQANGCNSKKEYGYVKLPGCKKCYPPCKHSYKTKIDSTHIDGKGHRKYKKCSKCGDTVELGYVTLSSCKICNPPLPTNQAEFEVYASRHGKPVRIHKNGSYHYVNFNTWRDHNHIFAYGIPSTTVPTGNRKDPNGNWQYHGYTESGHKFSSMAFNNTYFSGIVPERWNEDGVGKYVAISGADRIWLSLHPAQRNYMKNEKMRGHDATRLYPQKDNPAPGDYNIGLSKTLVQSPAMWKETSSIKINHTYEAYGAFVFYATFGQHSMGAGTITKEITVPADNDMGTADYIDIAVNVETSINKPDNQIGELKIELDGIDNSYISFGGVNKTVNTSNSASVNDTVRVKRPSSFPYTFTITGTAYVKSIFGDTLSESISKTVTIKGISDIEKPVINYSPNSSSWTNSSVSVKISVSDNQEMDYWKYRTSSDGGSTWGTWSGNLTSTSKEITFSDSKNYMIETYAVDKMGNSTNKTSGIYYIDKSSPAVSFSPNSKSWTSGNVSTVISISDSGSGLYRWRYRTSSNGGSSYGSWSSYITGSSRTISFTSSGSRKIQVQSYDNAGNSTTSSSGTFNIDKTSPSISFSTVNDTTQKVSVSDSYSGLYRWRYRTSVNNGVSYGLWSSYYYTSSRNIDLSGLYGDLKIQVRAYDNVGNSGTRTTGTLNIDSEKPEIAINPESTDWSKNSVTVSVNVTDNLELDYSRYRISLDEGNSWGVWSNEITDEDYEITLSSESHNRIEVQAYDKRGNSSTKEAGNYLIDKSSPVHNTTVISGYDYFDNLTTWWIKEGEELDIKTGFYDSLSGLYRQYLRLYNTTDESRAYHQWTSSGTHLNEYNTSILTDIISCTETLESGGDFETEFTVKGLDDSLSTVYVYGRDMVINNTGWINTGLKIGVDGTAPEADASIDYRDWGNDDINVEVNCSDSGGSGVDYWDYAWSNSTAPPASGYTRVYGTYKLLTYAQDDTVYLHIKVFDNVGNSEAYALGPYRKDSIAPENTVTPAMHNGSSEEIVLDIEITDENSGISEVLYLLTGTDTEPDRGDHSIATESSFSYTIPDTEDAVYYMHIISTDKAGNETYTCSGPYTIDTTAPLPDFGHISGGYAEGNNIYARYSDIIEFYAEGTDDGTGMMDVYLLADDGIRNPYRRHNNDDTGINYNDHTDISFGESTSQINNGNCLRAVFPIEVVTTYDYLVYDIQTMADDRSLPENTSDWQDTGLNLIIDNGLPYITASVDDGSYYGENLIANIEAGDTLSGISHTNYAVTESQEKPSEGWETSYSDDFQIELSEGKWYIHIETFDNVGNSYYELIGEISLINLSLSDFRISKAYDRDFYDLGFDIGVEDMAVYRDTEGEGINLGYVFDFEIDTTGLNDTGDTVEIEMKYYALKEDGTYEEADIYVKDDDGVWREISESNDYRNESYHRILTEEQRFESESEPDDEEKNTWKFDYFLPYDAIAIEKGTEFDIYNYDEFYDNKLLVAFNISGVKSTGETAGYNENETDWCSGDGSIYGENRISGMDIFGYGTGNGEVFYYNLYETVLDDLDQERVF
jgi:hypothetical protein